YWTGLNISVHRAGRLLTCRNFRSRLSAPAAASTDATATDCPMRAHEDRALHAETVEIRATDVLSQRTRARPERHDEHAIRIAFVFRAIRLQVIDHERNVLSRGRAAALHRDADHAVIGRPLSDVVVEHVCFNGLLFNLVAGAARHEDKDGAVVL